LKQKLIYTILIVFKFETFFSTFLESILDAVTLTHGPEEPTNSEPEPEKKSVMSRVKAKAIKVRDSIKKHGQNVFDHGSGHDTETQDTPDDDGDLVEDKQMVQDQKNRQVSSMFFSTLFLQLDYTVC
jgi:hypothetical protein